MDTQQLNTALQNLGMDATSWRALPLLPMVQVAWADGEVQEAERELILSMATERFHVQGDGLLLLRNWLTHAPSSTYARSGQQALVALCEHDRGAALPDDVLGDVVQLSTEVAAAAGGFFGFGAINKAEAEAIEQIAVALSVDHGHRWVTPEEDTVIPADADEANEGPEITVEFPTSSRATEARLIQFDATGAGETGCDIPAEGLRIGRSSAAEIQICFDGQVSRLHCEIVLRHGKYYIKDLDSTGGTWVNGERILERPLLGGEEISIGSSVFFFQLIKR